VEKEILRCTIHRAFRQRGGGVGPFRHSFLRSRARNRLATTRNEKIEKVAILLIVLLEFVRINAYIILMKSTEFKRWLAAQGATFEGAKGSHLKVLLNGKTSYLPMHSKELGTGLVQAIQKQLGLK
jgi:mRNA interferase HicA